MKPSTRQRAAVELRDGEILFNFENADLREVVRSILGEALALDYVYDPRVQGTVNVQTMRPVTTDVALETVETVLRMNGGALVRAGGLYEIVPLSEALKGKVVPELGAPGGRIFPGYAVRIVPLKFISAAETEKLLAPVLPPESVLRVDTNRNLLVVAGTSRQLATVLETIDTFDVDWLAGMSLGLFPLAAVDAETLIEELEEVFGADGNSPLAELVRLVPISRLNSVLVVTPQSAYLDRVEDWIKRLDRGTRQGQNLYVYYVKHGRAVDLAATLNEIFSGVRRRSEPRRDRLGELAPRRQPVTIATPPGEPVQIPPGLVEQMTGRAATSQSPELASAPSFDGERAGGRLAFSESAEIRVIAEEVNNALLILATPEDYRMVEAALRKLDIVPLQVLIEATIAEVKLTDELRFGLQWFFKRDDVEFTFGTGDSANVLPTFPGFSFIISDPNGPRLVLDTLESLTTINVISSPQLVVLDNQVAELQIGDEVPVATQQRQSVTDPDAPLVNTIEFRDTGVILRVIPSVNAGGAVNMEIEQEVSSISETVDSGVLTPTISQRRIKSRVAIQSGDTVVLGGLISEDNSRSRSGLPILSDIPYLGALFSARETSQTRTEILVLITPRVIRNQQEALAITEELRSRLRGLRDLGAFPERPDLLELLQ